MEQLMKSEFCEVSQEELDIVDGGSIMGLINGTLAGAAVGVIGGPAGFVAGAIVSAGVNYIYDHI